MFYGRFLPHRRSHWVLVRLPRAHRWPVYSIGRSCGIQSQSSAIRKQKINWINPSGVLTCHLQATHYILEYNLICGSWYTDHMHALLIFVLLELRETSIHRAFETYQDYPFEVWTKPLPSPTSNGGASADASNFATRETHRFRKPRWNVAKLHATTSHLTPFFIYSIFYHIL